MKRPLPRGNTSVPSGERFRVVDVKANSPAYFAGLRRGHLISEIDTKPANYYSLEEARRALRADGTHSVTVVESGEKKHKLNLELQSN